MRSVIAMTRNDDQGVGKRVAATRRLKGWTQHMLAQEANVSSSLISQVERGVTPASPAFVSAVARALSISTADLLEQPYPRTTRDEQEIFEGIPGIRRELAAYRIPPEDTPPRPFCDLRADVARVSELRHSVKLADLGQLLPKVLHDLRISWYSTEGPARERVFALAAEAYAASSQVAYTLGYIDLSSLAVERFEWAADQCGDELMVLWGDYQRAGELIMVADWNSAEQLLDRSRARIEDRIGGSDPSVLTMLGNLHLKSALAAARGGKRDAADSHLAEAREISERTGEGKDPYQLWFGPGNVDIWSVALATEMMDGVEAIKRNDKAHLPPLLPRERIGHHYIDLARAFLLAGDRHGAFSALQVAKRISPTRTRFHPMVHETIRQLARDEARASETVRGFAAWCGITSLD